MKCSDCRFWQTDGCTNNPDGVDFNYAENFACFKPTDKGKCGVERSIVSPATTELPEQSQPVDKPAPPMPTRGTGGKTTRCSDCIFWQTDGCTNNPDGVDFNYADNFACFKLADKGEIETGQQPLHQRKQKVRWGPIAVGTAVGTVIMLGLGALIGFSAKGLYWIDSSDLRGVFLLTAPVSYTHLRAHERLDL